MTVASKTLLLSAVRSAAAVKDDGKVSDGEQFLYANRGGKKSNM